MPYILRHLIPTHTNVKANPATAIIGRLLSTRGAQRGVSIKTGIPASSISRYLGGIREPSLRHGVRLAKALGVTVEQLVDALPRSQPAP